MGPNSANQPPGSTRCQNSPGCTRGRSPSCGHALGVLVILVALASGCATSPPDDPENICAIFKEKRSWRKAAQRSEKRWGTPVHVQMAIIFQESAFEHDARPPRDKLLGIIPWKRPSNAYGYARAVSCSQPLLRQVPRFQPPGPSW